MHKVLPFLFLAALISSCTSSTGQRESGSIPIKGTWRLLSSTTVTKGQRTFVDYTKGLRMIKIINDTHFAFLKHDLKLDAAGKNNFDAGGGRYTLAGDTYTEFLAYYNDKNWEGKTFTFKVKIQNDTLLQTGVEKVEKASVDRTITEKYIRVKTQ